MLLASISIICLFNLFIYSNIANNCRVLFFASIYFILGCSVGVVWQKLPAMHSPTLIHLKIAWIQLLLNKQKALNEAIIWIANSWRQVLRHETWSRWFVCAVHMIAPVSFKIDGKKKMELILKFGLLSDITSLFITHLYISNITHVVMVEPVWFFLIMFVFSIRQIHGCIVPCVFTLYCENMFVHTCVRMLRSSKTRWPATFHAALLVAKLLELKCSTCNICISTGSSVRVFNYWIPWLGFKALSGFTVSGAIQRCNAVGCVWTIFHQKVWWLKSSKFCLLLCLSLIFMRFACLFCLNYVITAWKVHSQTSL